MQSAPTATTGTTSVKGKIKANNINPIIISTNPLNLNKSIKPIAATAITPTTKTTTATSASAAAAAAEIEEISKKISEHADAIYRTWKSCGLAPTELLNIYTNTTTTIAAGAAAAVAIDPTTVTADSDLLTVGDTTTTEGLQKLVSTFVIKDKEQRGMKTGRVSNNNNNNTTNNNSINSNNKNKSNVIVKQQLGTIGGLSNSNNNNSNNISRKTATPTTTSTSTKVNAAATATTSRTIATDLMAATKNTTLKTPAMQKSTAILNKQQQQQQQQQQELSQPTNSNHNNVDLYGATSKKFNNKMSTSKTAAKNLTSTTTTKGLGKETSIAQVENILKTNACAKLTENTGVALHDQQLNATQEKKDKLRYQIPTTATTTSTTTSTIPTTTTTTKITTGTHLKSNNNNAHTPPTLDLDFNIDLNLDLNLDINNLTQLQTQNLLKIKELLHENAENTKLKKPKTTTKKAMSPTPITTTTHLINRSPIATSTATTTTTTTIELPTAVNTLTQKAQKDKLTAVNNNNKSSTNSSNSSSSSKQKVAKNRQNALDTTAKTITTTAAAATTNATTNANANAAAAAAAAATAADEQLTSVIASHITSNASDIDILDAVTAAIIADKNSGIVAVNSKRSNNATATSALNKMHIKSFDEHKIQRNAVSSSNNKIAKDLNNEKNDNDNENDKTKVTAIAAAAATALTTSTTKGNSSKFIKNKETVNTNGTISNNNGSNNAINLSNNNNNNNSVNNNNNKTSNKQLKDKSDKKETAGNNSMMPAPTKAKTSTRPLTNGQDKALSRPILTRGSVAERVLMFEKCPDVRNAFLNIKRPSPNDGKPKVLLKVKLHSTPPAPSQEQHSLQREIRNTKSVYIPRFYFPHGKPQPQIALERTLRNILSAFDSFPNNQVTKDELPQILKICGLPFYWRMPVMVFCQQNNSGLVERQRFVEFWKQMNVYCHEAASRFVYILSRGQRFRSYILPEDLAPLVQDVVDTHPGLAFLKEATEFHSRYVHTVIARIFYAVNRSWSGRISISELKKSDLLEIITLLEEEDDINQIMAFFSYEHFYVIYCKFWELDKDHDLLINQDDLSKHSDHALSTRIIERIFSGCVTRSDNKKNPDDEPKMSYTDFVWFLLSEEDKRTPTAIEYWFRCMDVDGDGMLSMYELEYFYEEQQQRMESIGIETLPFEDCLCQMLDMIKPQRRDCITLSDLKHCKMTHVFFDTFFNLEKYLDHEQRDPFASQRDDYGSDWDRFAAHEYELLITEEND